MGNGTSFRGPLTYNGKGGPKDDWFEKLPFMPNPDYFNWMEDWTGKNFDSEHTWHKVVFNSGTSDLLESDNGTRGGWVFLRGADNTDNSGAYISTNVLYQVEAGTRLWFEARVVFWG